MDNDCDGLIDATRLPDGGVTLPQPPVGLCVQLGLCAGTAATCIDGGFRCDYAASGAELNADGGLASVETRCNGFDDNCNGITDDAPAFATKGQSCRVGHAACAVSGTLACSSSGTSVICCQTTGTNGVCTSPAVADLSRASPEVCNGRDDDCDGITDNPGGTCDSMIQVTRADGGTFFVDRYEASRPDAVQCSPTMPQSAQQCDAGTATSGRACSNSLRIPWGNVSFDVANAACQGAGKRLCTQTEWERSCQGTGVPRTFPYGDVYVASACNGHDFSATADEAIQTGILATCSSPLTAQDLSGNLREWTSTPVPEIRSCTTTANCVSAMAGSSYRATSTCNGSAGACQCVADIDCAAPSTCFGGRCGLCQNGSCVFKLHGGGFNNISTGLTCTFDSAFDFQTVSLPVYGFRCCRDTAPLQANGQPCP